MVATALAGRLGEIQLAGEFDMMNAEEIRSAAVRLASRGATVLLVDVSEVTFMGAAGLGALVSARRAFNDDMTVVGPSPFLRQLLQLIGLASTTGGIQEFEPFV